MHDAPAFPTPANARHLDRSRWNQLNAGDFRLLDLVGFLSKLQAHRSPSGAHYCTPGRRWLAHQLACSVRTISRRTAHLARIGILTKQQRRPRRGQWQTNLYRIVGRAGWRAAALAHQLRRLSHRLSQPARLATPDGSKNCSQRPNESLRDIIARGMTKFAPG